MNISKYIAFAAVAAAATGAFAGDSGAGQIHVSFSTTADYYADGKPVADGEWYAVCWSKDGVFEGITTTYGPLDSNDRVLFLAPAAKDGKCFNRTFEVDYSERPEEGGKYCVIMLDTRDADGNAALPKSKTELVPERAATAEIAKAKYDAPAATDAGKQTSVATAGWDKTIDPAEATTAKIVGIEVKNAEIVITVDGAMEGVRYNLKSGDTPTTVETYETPVTATETKGQEIPVKKGEGDAKFYKLTHEPATR